MKRIKLAAVAAPASIALTAMLAASASASPMHDIAPAAQTVNMTEANDDQCEVTDATLRWGTLERWRSYVSGSIAKGSWEVDGNAAYELPEFVWSGGSGSISPDGSTASFDFTGAVMFSGHNDLLQVEIANPGVDVTAGSDAMLTLDITATDTSGEPNVAETDAPSVEAALDNPIQIDGEAFTFTATGGALTSGGVDAFGGFYEVGEPVDSFTVSGTLSPGCGEAVAEPDDTGEPEPTQTPEMTTMAPESDAPASTDDEASFPVVPVVIGAVALLVIGGAVTYLVVTRKPRAAVQSEPDEQ